MTQEDKVWTMHCHGFAPSQIAQLFNMGTQEVKNIIIKCWAQDKRSSKL